MKSLPPLAPFTLTAVLLVAALLLAPGILSAEEKRPAAIDRSAPDTEPTIFRLHHTSRACGKKWARKAAQLSQQQLGWMLGRHHRVYRYKADGRPVITLEVLSTPSFRDCQVAESWSRRETTVLATLHLADGSTRTRMHFYGEDDVFFNRVPAVFPTLGKVLLKGETADGRISNRWLNLDSMAPWDRSRESKQALATAVLAAF